MTRDGRTQDPDRGGDDLELADAHAERGTVKHLMLRLGYMPRDEADAERLVRELAERDGRPRRLTAMATGREARR